MNFKALALPLLLLMILIVSFQIPVALASPRAVGGILIPVVKAEILAPWIGLALAAAVVATFAVKRRRS